MDFGIPYLVCAGIVVFAAFAIPWWIHNWHATPTEKQLGGEIGYAAIALMFFLIPTALAYSGRLVHFPGLFTTVMNLEGRASLCSTSSSTRTHRSSPGSKTFNGYTTTAPNRSPN